MLFMVKWKKQPMKKKIKTEPVSITKRVLAWPQPSHHLGQLMRGPLANLKDPNGAGPLFFFPSPAHS